MNWEQTGKKRGRVLGSKKCIFSSCILGKIENCILTHGTKIPKTLFVSGTEVQKLFYLRFSARERQCFYNSVCLSAINSNLLVCTSCISPARNGVFTVRYSHTSPWWTPRWFILSVLFMLCTLSEFSYYRPKTGSDIRYVHIYICIWTCENKYSFSPFGLKKEKILFSVKFLLVLACYNVVVLVCVFVVLCVYWYSFSRCRTAG